MNKRILILLLLISTFTTTHSQSRWFKHLTGWTALQSFVHNDTIHSFGMGVEKISSKDKFFVTYSLTGINGDSFSSYNISFDTIGDDSVTSITIISSQAGFNKDNNMYLPLRLSIKGKLYRSFLSVIQNDKILLIDEIAFDTFATVIQCQLPVGNNLLIAGKYSRIISPQSIWPTTFIIKRTDNGINNLIKQYIGSSSAFWLVPRIKSNKNSLSDFFVLLEKQWNFHGSPEEWEYFLVKMDTSGDEIWRTKINGNDSINPVGMKFVQKPDGNLIAAWADQLYRPYMKPGVPSNLSQAKEDCSLWFAEIDQDGSVLWRRNIREFLTSVLGQGVWQDLDLSKSIVVSDGIIWIGTHWNGYYRNFILKTDFEGNPIWFRHNKLYPDNENERGFFVYDISQTSDEGFLITGEYISYPGNVFPELFQRATIMKVDSLGCLIEGCDKVTITEESTSIKQFNVFPNPAEGIIHISNGKQCFEKYSVRIRNILGQLIYNQEFISDSKINLFDHMSGIYFIEIQNNNKHEIHKIILDN